VDQAKAERDENSGSPKTESAAVRGLLEDASIKTGEATGESVLQITAEEEFLKESDGEEAGNPGSSVTENVATKEQATVDNKQAGFDEQENKQGEKKDSP